MYSGWRSWRGFPDGWFVRNPMYDPDVAEGSNYWHARKRSSLSVRPNKPDWKNEPNAATKPPPGTLHDLNNRVGRFATEVTSAHGLPHIYTSKSVFGRVMWTLIVLSALCVFAWQMEKLISRFLAFDTITEVEIISRSSLEFPSVTVCNTNTLRRSAIATSQHRHVLFIDDLTPLPYYIPCEEGDIKCDNGELCVRSYLKCDGVNHCRDGTDETNCTYGSCGGEMFKCQNGSGKGYCIDSNLECDGIRQCYDGEDEWSCTCRISEYKCTKQGGCIPRTLVCNGRQDCVDGSDEDKCSDRDDCSEGFLCQSSFPQKCILRSFICDGYKDCDNGEDEDVPGSTLCNTKPTDGPPECTTEEFDCGNGECVQLQYQCDQDPDCSNFKDEMNCGAVRCDNDQLQCGNKFQCVAEYDLCDFKQDCSGADPTDEKGCGCSLVTEADETLSSVNCGGNIRTVEVDDSGEISLYVKCQSPNSRDSSYAPSNWFDCNGQLTCANAANTFPETCTSVFTECYVNANGADYKGRVDETSTDKECKSWSEQLSADYGYNANKFPLLGDHNFCRNPGGAKTKPWCFIEDSGSATSSSGTTSETRANHWDFCTITTEKATCHAGIDLSVRITGGRVEVQHQGIWGTIQDTNWEMNDAAVVCRMLNLGSPESVSNSGLAGPASAPVLISFINCQGSERTLLDCVFKLASASPPFDHSSDVGVVCGSVSARNKRGVEIIEVKMEEHAKMTDLFRQKRSADGYVGEGSGDDEDKDIEFGNEGKVEAVDRANETFKCRFTGQLLPLWQVCNNIPDCPDGDDEIYCSNTLCKLGERPCRLEEQCIPTNRECDGFYDCEKYGLDEAFCVNMTSCPYGYWLCPDRPVCISLYSVCNTIDDCGNGMDEANCTFDGLFQKPDDPFEDANWYKDFLNLTNDPSIFEQFAEFYYRPNSFSRVKGENPVDWKSFFTFSQSADYQDLLSVLHLNKQEIKRFGHQFEDFILECHYDESECYQENFTLFETDDFGNCYSFNYNPNGSEVYSTKTGPVYGLRMTLNLQQDEYISLTGREAGVRVTITPRDVRPLPDENGVTIKPGVVSSIALRYENISRLGGRYGDCYSEDFTYKTFENGEIVENTHDAYDRQLCLRACLHDNILTHCGCSDTVLLRGPRCLVTNNTQDVCKQLMHFLHNSDMLGCDCKQQCRTRTYTKTTSQSKWPSNVYRKHLLRYIRSIRPDTTANINDRQSVEDNLVRLEVFYEQLNYATTSESAAYTSYSLISDTGGTAGLYIGFSIITFIEFGVLLYQLCRRCCCPWMEEDDEPGEEPVQLRKQPYKQPRKQPPSPPKFSKTFDWNY